MNYVENESGILLPMRRAGEAGVVGLTDAIVPDLFGSYTNEDTVELTAFADSGVVQTGDIINNMVAHGGGSITLPFWNDLDSDDEPNYSNDNPADMAEPDKLGSGEMSARVAFLNNGWAATDLVQELAGSDPNARIASRVDAWWARQWQKRILNTCVGLYNENVASHSGDMVFDATKATDPSAQVFNAENFIDAAYTMGDHVGTLRVIGVHSMIAKRMAKNDLIDTIRDSEGNILYLSFKDTRIVMDDSMPTFGTGADRTYLSILFGSGSIVSGFGRPRVPVEVDRTPRAGHGGGMEELWTRRTWLIHPKGYKFVGSTLTGNGSTDAGAPWKNANWSDLQKAGNWQRIQDRKKVNMAFMLTKG